MKKIMAVILIVISTIMITGCSNNNTVTEINFKDLEEKINNKDSFILEVIQTGCSHCEEFSPRFRAVLKTNNLEAYSINIYNLSDEERKEFNDLVTISGTPTVIFFDKGKEENKISGAVSNEKLEEELKESGYIKENK